MEDRIQVNGVWYIRETGPAVNPEPVEIPDDEPTNYLGCVWETDEWCFEASILLEDDATTLQDVSKYGPTIEVTDKRPENRNDWIVHDCIDNDRWMRGVLINHHEAMPDAYRMFDNSGLETFRMFLRHLVKKGWLKDEE